jgi:hypothetical protein
MDEKDDSVFFDELRWRLSNINPNIPEPTQQLPPDLTAETLLVHDVLQLEAQVRDWQASSNAYRELAQIAIEAAARHYANAVRVTRENKALREFL